jgi:hypothetical protein
MCGVDAKQNKGVRSSDLCTVKPLDNGMAYEQVDDVDVWHPNWSVNADTKVNKVFVNKAIKLVWENEEVSGPFFKTHLTYLVCSVFGRRELGRSRMPTTRCQPLRIL